ncbi:MAG: hypothetical protein ACI87E_002002, partial [Mariniblastus sp.]
AKVQAVKRIVPSLGGSAIADQINRERIESNFVFLNFRAMAFKTMLRQYWKDFLLKLLGESSTHWG